MTKVLSVGGSIVVPEKPDTVFLSQFVSMVKEWLSEESSRKLILVVGGGALGFDAEIVQALQDFCQFAHIFGGILLPILADKLILAVEGGRRDEEEVAEGPKFFDEVDFLHLHHAHHGLHALNGLLDTILAEDFVESGGQHFVVGLEDVFAVEPLSLHVVELRASLRALRDVEEADEVVHREDFLIAARIPAQQGKEIDQEYQGAVEP